MNARFSYKTILHDEPEMDYRLQAALSKMTPAETCVRNGVLCWGKEDYPGVLSGVKESELLHLCAIIEESLNEQERDDYYYSGICGDDRELEKAWTVSASWRWRAVNLAKVKGIEI